jgi:hypothetical protein
MLKNKDMVNLKPLLFLLIFLLSFSLVNAVDLQQDLVGYYSYDPFSSTIADDSSYSHDLTLTGPSEVSGVLGSGLDFTPNDRASAADNAEYDQSDSIMLCSWINIDTATDSKYLFFDDGWGIRQELDGSHGGCTAGNKFAFVIVGKNTVCNNAQTFTEDTWEHWCFIKNSTHVTYYKNGVQGDKDAETNTMNTGTGTFNIGWDGGTNYADFLVDETGIWTAGHSGYVSELYNSGDGCNPVTNQYGCNVVPGSDPFKIYSYNSETLSQILTFNATISGLSTYTTTNGTLNTPLLQNDTGLYNITINAPSYFPKYYKDYSPATNINASLTPIGFLNFTFSNYTTISTLNYTRNLVYSYSYICSDKSTSTLNRQINNTQNLSVVLTCTNTTQTGSGSFKFNQEGAYDISFTFETDIGLSSALIRNQSFISDLVNPTLSGFSFELSEGFITPTAVINFTCTDNIISTLTYYSYFNGALIDEETHPSGTEHSNSTTAIINGDNNATVKCSDGFGTTSDTEIKNVLLRTLFLIDEQDNTAFNLPNATSLIAYIDDNRTSFNFKTQGTSNISFTATTNVKLRFEIVYSDGTIILRYVDTGLTEDNIRVCVNKDGVTHYEQILTSSVVRPVVLNSVFADCLVAADYTRFAYQNVKILKAYTYNNLYYLYTFANNDPDDTQIFLASVDGSLATFINLDTLEFLERGYDITTIGDAVAVSKRNANEMNILYYNVLQNNDALRIAITNAGTGQVYFNSTSFSDKNEANIIFNFATLGTNETTLFKVYVTKTINGIDNTIIKYFTSEGVTGSVNSGLIFLVSLFLLIFGLSFTIAQRAFAWFGIIIIISNLGLLSYAVGAWYITFSMAVNAIILIYIFLIMNAKNSAEIG